MRKVIIIGATSGIGKGLAELLAGNGYFVGITGRRAHLLEELKAKKPGSYLTKTFDVTQTNSMAGQLDELTQELGGLDLLIISSGTGDLNEKLDFEIEKKAIDTNVTGFTAISDWAFNYFEKQNYGQLVAISSVGGLLGNRQAPAYSATKAYQINYLEGLRMKALKASIPIFITDIRPGFVNTEMAKGEKFFWMADVEKAVLQIFRAIHKKRKVAYITKRWKIIACIFKHGPKWLLEKM